VSDNEGLQVEAAGGGEQLLQARNLLIGDAVEQ
jgi:hypothetical protein